MDGHVSSCTWLAHLWTKYVNSNPFKGDWFILRFKENLTETMVLLDQFLFVLNGSFFMRRFILIHASADLLLHN
jgi:hypothetical protein